MSIIVPVQREITLEAAYPFIDPELLFALANRARTSEQTAILRLTRNLPLCCVTAVHASESRLDQDFDRLDVKPMYNLILSLLILLRRYGVRGHGDQRSV